MLATVGVTGVAQGKVLGPRHRSRQHLEVEDRAVVVPELVVGGGEGGEVGRLLGQLLGGTGQKIGVAGALAAGEQAAQLVGPGHDAVDQLLGGLAGQPAQVRAA